MEDDVSLRAAERFRQDEIRAERAYDWLAGWVDVANKDFGPRQARCETCNEETYCPCANDHDLISRTCFAVPCRVQSRLHVGRKNGAACRESVRQGRNRIARRRKNCLMRMQSENCPSDQVRRSFLHHA